MTKYMQLDELLVLIFANSVFVVICLALRITETVEARLLKCLHVSPNLLHLPIYKCTAHLVIFFKKSKFSFEK